MTTLRCNDNWVQFNSHENECFEDDQEEALSLCDLPTTDHQLDTNSNKEDNDQEDFEFGSGHAAASAFQSPENMCAADEVFFQGQILPLRHSVGSKSVVNDTKTKIRNQFYSHPSPSPNIRTRTSTRNFRKFSRSKSKTLWSFLQVGVVKPQEIGLWDLKNRSKSSGSYNSNSSSNSNSNSNAMKDKNKKQKHNRMKKQKLLLGGCNCAPDSVERTITERVSKERTVVGDGRQTASRNRTFEWLKQLSIAAPSEA